MDIFAEGFNTSRAFCSDWAFGFCQHMYALLFNVPFTCSETPALTLYKEASKGAEQHEPRAYTMNTAFFKEAKRNA